jgi:type IV secretory pathway VirB2 component (pilin)
MIFRFLLLFSSLQNIALAGSLKGTADALGSELTRIGLAVGLISLVIAGTYLHMGKQEGGQKVTQSIVGIIVILSATTIISTLRSVVGGA